MTSELAKAICEACDFSAGNYCAEAIDRVLAAHGITDGLVDAHAKANELIMAYLAPQAGPNTGSNIDAVNDYIAAEIAANRWEE